jgi:hypothetical protein
MWSEGYTFPAGAAVRDEFRRVSPDGGDDYLRFWYVNVLCAFTPASHRRRRAVRVVLVWYVTRATLVVPCPR